MAHSKFASTGYWYWDIQAMLSYLPWIGTIQSCPMQGSLMLLLFWVASTSIIFIMRYVLQPSQNIDALEYSTTNRPSTFYYTAGFSLDDLHILSPVNMIYSHWRQDFLLTLKCMWLGHTTRAPVPLSLHWYLPLILHFPHWHPHTPKLVGMSILDWLAVCQLTSKLMKLGCVWFRVYLTSQLFVLYYPSEYTYSW